MGGRTLVASNRALSAHYASRRLCQLRSLVYVRITSIGSDEKRTVRRCGIVSKRLYQCTVYLHVCHQRTEDPEETAPIGRDDPKTLNPCRRSPQSASRGNGRYYYAPISM